MQNGFIAPAHPVFQEPKVGHIVAFWHPPMTMANSYLGHILEMEYLNEAEGTYYSIQTNNGVHHGCFKVVVLASCLEMQPSKS